MIYRYLIEKTKYKIYASLAHIGTTLYLTMPNDVIGDAFYSLHKRYVQKAHTARMNAQRELNGKSD